LLKTEKIYGFGIVLRYLLAAPQWLPMKIHVYLAILTVLMVVLVVAWRSW